MIGPWTRHVRVWFGVVVVILVVKLRWIRDALKRVTVIGVFIRCVFKSDRNWLDRCVQVGV